MILEKKHSVLVPTSMTPAGKSQLEAVLYEVSCGYDSLPSGYVLVLPDGKAIAYTANATIFNDDSLAISHVSELSQQLPGVFHDPRNCDLLRKGDESNG